MDSQKIFKFLADKAKKKEKTALVTVTNVQGSSIRNPGDHMGVSESGEFSGSFSGGCIEAAVVAEAQNAIIQGEPRLVRFGKGSPYLDIKLPCGGGLDLLFFPIKNDTFSKPAVEAFEKREPFQIGLPAGAEDILFQPLAASKIEAQKIEKREGCLWVGHYPHPKLLIIGHGGPVHSLARQAHAFGATIEIFTPDILLANDLRAASFNAKSFKTMGHTSLIQSDQWTAIVFLFHDHDWEGVLLAHALRNPHFYIGAMGSKIAHTNRRHILKDLGVSGKKIDTIHGPIGLFHSSGDPDTLALSILGEIIQQYHIRCGPDR